MNIPASFVLPGFNMVLTFVEIQRKHFKIGIEINEAREDTWCHKKGDKFEYPADMVKL